MVVALVMWLVAPVMWLVAPAMWWLVLDQFYSPLRPSYRMILSSGPSVAINHSVWPSRYDLFAIYLMQSWEKSVTLGP